MKLSVADRTHSLCLGRNLWVQAARSYQSAESCRSRQRWQTWVAADLVSLSSFLNHTHAHTHHCITESQTDSRCIQGCGFGVARAGVQFLKSQSRSPAKKRTLHKTYLFSQSYRIEWYDGQCVIDQTTDTRSLICGNLSVCIVHSVQWHNHPSSGVGVRI